MSAKCPIVEMGHDFSPLFWINDSFQLCIITNIALIKISIHKKSSWTWHCWFKRRYTWTCDKHTVQLSSKEATGLQLCHPCMGCCCPQLDSTTHFCGFTWLRCIYHIWKKNKLTILSDTAVPSLHNTGHLRKVILVKGWKLLENSFSIPTFKTGD